MVIEFFKGGADQELEEVHGQIVQMLQDCRHTFDLAVNSLLGGSDPDVVHAEIKSTDRRVNRAQRQVRRALVVHTSVRGTRADLTAVLGSMSIVKDAERIGDYAKNIWDLASTGIDMSSASDIDQLVALRDTVSAALGDGARILKSRDAEGAHQLIQELDEYQSAYDDLITGLIQGEESSTDAVPRALLFRYLKRITAHLINVLTSLVMPLDRLDYYDEDKADRV